MTNLSDFNNEDLSSCYSYKSVAGDCSQMLVDDTDDGELDEVSKKLRQQERIQERVRRVRLWLLEQTKRESHRFVKSK